MHPQVVTLIDTLKTMVEPGAPRLWELPASVGRPRADAFLRALNAGGPEMAQTRTLAIPGPRGRLAAEQNDLEEVVGQMHDRRRRDGHLDGEKQDERRQKESAEPKSREEREPRGQQCRSADDHVRHGTGL